MPIWFEEWLTARDELPYSLPSDGVAVIVHGMQNQLVDDDGVYSRVGFDATRSRAIVPGVAAVLETARAEGIPVIHSPEAFTAIPSAVPRGRILDALDAERAALTPERLDYQLAIIPEAQPIAGELVLPRTGQSAFAGTALAAHLKRLGVDSLILVGGLTSGAVEATGRDANPMGLGVVTVYDATVDWDDSHHDHALYAVDWASGQVLTTEQITASYRAAQPA